MANCRKGIEQKKIKVKVPAKIKRKMLGSRFYKDDRDGDKIERSKK